MPTVSATFTPIYAPGLRKVIFENYTYRPKQYTMFLNVGSSSRQYEEDYKMGGFGAVPVKPEGTAIVYDDPVPGSTVRYVWEPYGKGFRATHEAMEDDLYGPMRKMAAALGRAFANQEEIIGARILNNAFTAPAAGATNAGFDGVALCDLSHPLLRGGTQRNEPSVPVDLSHTAAQDGLVDFERLVDESGVPIMVMPRKLLISPEQVPLAREITGSTLKPGSSDNDINTLNGSLEIVVSHYKTNTKSWFLFADKSDTDVWLIMRERFRTEASDDFDTGDGKMKGYMRLREGFGDYRGVWGSPGT